ncbi:MAG: flagellar biosynthesis protein FlhB [Defluviitaleaceae bacterium]|nr:flagellar biosynthesis protein FlhB [Defluviitaleaceae bacterium]MCL2264112.1 flagellar biosynthesis protein FlhB [Defluviitaleaceae bacterium]
MNLLRLNLQFFNDGGGEKTETATPKKRKKTRDEGQVAKSQEVSTATMLIVGFFALSLFAGGILEDILDVFRNNRDFFNPNMAYTFCGLSIARHVAWGMGRVIMIALPMFIVTTIVILIMNFLQVGWNPTTKPLKPKFSAMNPLKGFKKIVSLQSLVTFVKSMLKIIFVGIVAYFILITELDTIPAILVMPFVEVLGYIGDLIVTLGISIGVLFIFIAIFDYAYMKWKHEKDIRMSKHEVKEEWKQAEGNPQIKQKIRQKMREASMRRMMQNVPQADVIITNPTHYAVALKYDMLGMGGAPVLIGKGVDFMAKRIREAGIEHDIPIIENPPLARALYAQVEIDDEIPEELYVAVAEIMAYVFKLKNRAA